MYINSSLWLADFWLESCVFQLVSVYVTFTWVVLATASRAKVLVQLQNKFPNLFLQSKKYLPISSTALRLHNHGSAQDWGTSRDLKRFDCGSPCKQAQREVEIWIHNICPKETFVNLTWLLDLSVNGIEMAELDCLVHVSSRPDLVVFEQELGCFWTTTWLFESRRATELSLLLLLHTALQSNRVWQALNKNNWKRIY